LRDRNSLLVNPLTPNVNYSGRTASLTSKVAFYIFIQQIITDYFKNGIYSPFFFSSKCSLFHNSNVFGSCVIHILYTGCAKIKKNNSGAKSLIEEFIYSMFIKNEPKVSLLCNFRDNLTLNSARHHNQFITEGNYKATCFDYRLVIFRPIFVNCVTRCYAHFGMPSCLQPWNTSN